MPSQGEHPLRPIVGAWLNKITLALDFKKKKYQDRELATQP